MKRVWCSAVLAVAMSAGTCRAFAQTAKAPVATASAADEQELASTQAQLFRLLRVSPMLTEVVERDPSLLANADYVNRSNPELAQFLTAHPEVARNPEFYLFSGFRGERGQRFEALERKVWSGSGPMPQEDPNLRGAFQTITPLLAFLGFIAAMLWLIHFFVTSRRWQRTFKLQMDAHEKLIERFSSDDQLMAYMETAGKRLLEGPSMSDLGDGGTRMPNVVSRVLISLQVGVVLVLLGIGLLLLRFLMGYQAQGLLVAGIVFLMPGIGFIVSAGISWTLAKRLGLLPAMRADASVA